MKVKELISLVDNTEVDIFYDDGRYFPMPVKKEEKKPFSFENEEEKFYVDIYKDELNICSIGKYSILKDEYYEIVSKERKEEYEKAIKAGLIWEDWMNNMTWIAGKDGKWISYVGDINNLSNTILEQEVTRIINVYWDEKNILMVGIKKENV